MVLLVLPVQTKLELFYLVRSTFSVTRFSFSLSQAPCQFSFYHAPSSFFLSQVPILRVLTFDWPELLDLFERLKAITAVTSPVHSATWPLPSTAAVPCIATES